MHTHWSQFVPYIYVSPTSEDIKLHIIISGVTSFGRVWRKVPGSDAPSVLRALRQNEHAHAAFRKDVLLHHPLLCRTELLLATLAWG